jgi:hypothetical protein
MEPRESRPVSSRLLAIFALLAAASAGGCFVSVSDSPAPGTSTPASGPAGPGSNNNEASCAGQSQAGTAGLPNGATVPSVSGANVLALTVNGATCAANSYPNKPCVDVTICKAGSSGATDCETITDVLLDTGSYGLRVFKQAVTNSALLADLEAAKVVAPNGGSLTECAQYGDGSAQWGPVVKADVVLGGEAAATVSIELIDSTFGTVPGSCPAPSTSPSDGGFNAILGVGLFTADCGNGCATRSSNAVYFSCTGASCIGSKAPVANQVTNPVSALAVDKNGVILELPEVPLGGAPSASGYLVLGIGTRANNTPPTGVGSYAADPNVGQFTTNFNCTAYDSFVDSGSNALFFQAPSSSELPDCGSVDSQLSGWFCPSALQSFSATTIGSGTSVSASVAFDVGDFFQLAQSGNSVFAEIGADGTFGSSVVFDWGLPFYFGRNVYVGLESTSSPLGTGPYWGY